MPSSDPLSQQGTSLFNELADTVRAHAAIYRQPVAVEDKDSAQLSRRRPLAPQWSMKPLTTMQAAVLHVVAEYGPLTPAEADRHWNLDRGRSRSVLVALEKRRLVEATYTQASSRAYVITERGEEANVTWVDEED